MANDLSINIGGQNSFGRLTFTESEAIAESLGKGWRIPSIEELEFIQQYYDLDVLNLSKEAYWTIDREINDEPTSESWAIGYYFSFKKKGGIPKSERIKARLVRSI